MKASSSEARMKTAPRGDPRSGFRWQRRPGAYYPRLARGMHKPMPQTRAHMGINAVSAASLSIRGVYEEQNPGVSAADAATLTASPPTRDCRLATMWAVAQTATQNARILMPSGTTINPVRTGVRSSRHIVSVSVSGLLPRWSGVICRPRHRVFSRRRKATSTRAVSRKKPIHRLATRSACLATAPRTPPRSQGVRCARFHAHHAFTTRNL